MKIQLDILNFKKNIIASKTKRVKSAREISGRLGCIGEFLNTSYGP